MKFTQFVRDYLANNKDSGLTYREAMKDDGVRCAYKQYEADLCKKGIVRAPEKRPEPKKRYNKKTECGDNVINQTINTPQYSPAQPQAAPSPPPQVGFQGPPPVAPKGSFKPSFLDQMAASPYYQQNPLIFEEAKKNYLAAVEQAKAQPRRPAARQPVRVELGSDFGDDSTVVSELPEGEYAMRPPLRRGPARVQMDDDYSTVVSQADDGSTAASYPGSDSVSIVQGPPVENEVADDNVPRTLTQQERDEARGYASDDSQFDDMPPGEPIDNNYYDDGGFGPGSLAIPEVNDFPESYREEAKAIIEDEEKLKEALDDMLDNMTEKQLKDLKERYVPRTQFFSPRFSSGPLQGRMGTERDLKFLPATSDIAEKMRGYQASDLSRRATQAEPEEQINYVPRSLRFAPTATERGDTIPTSRPTTGTDDLGTPSQALPTADERKRALRQGKAVKLSDDSINEIRQNIRDFDDDVQKRQQGQQVQNTLLDIIENEVRSIWGLAIDETKDEIGDLISKLVDESVDDVTKEEVAKKLSEEIDNLVPSIEAKDIAESVAEDILSKTGEVIDNIEYNKARESGREERIVELGRNLTRASMDEWGRLQDRTSIGNDLRRLVDILGNPEERRKWMSDPQKNKDLENAIAWMQVSEDVEEEIVNEFLQEMLRPLASSNNRYVKKIKDKIIERQRRRPQGRVRGRVSSLPTKSVRRVGKLQRKEDTFSPFPFDAMDVEGSGLGNKKERMKQLLSAIIDLV